MGWLFDRARAYALEWMVGLAAVMSVVQIVTPRIADWLLQAMIVGIVWGAGKMVRART